MIQAEWVDHDTIRIPATAMGGGAIGAGAQTIDAADSRFAVWAAWLHANGVPRPGSQTAAMIHVACLNPLHPGPCTEFGALSGAALDLFNELHPRGPGGKFRKKSGAEAQTTRDTRAQRTAGRTVIRSKAGPMEFRERDRWAIDHELAQRGLPYNTRSARSRAVIRQTIRDLADERAKALQRIEGGFNMGASDRAMRSLMGSSRRLSRIVERDTAFDKLEQAIAGGDRPRIDAALAETLDDMDLQRIGGAGARGGEVATFDPRLHRPLQGERLRPGQRVEIYEPGYQTRVLGEPVVLVPAKVRAVDDPDPNLPADPAFDRVVRTVRHSPETSRRPLYGGGTSTTELVTFADGTQLVSKQAAPNWGGLTARERRQQERHEADTEALSGMLGAAIGANVPRVYQDTPDHVWMQYLPGVSPDAVTDTMRHSRAAARLGLLDVLVNNSDRSDRNLVADAQRLAGIDHGAAYLDLGAPNPWADTFHPDRKQPADFFVTKDGTWVDNPLTPEDITELRRIVDDLAPEYGSRRRKSWLNYTRKVISNLARHATGTTPLLGSDSGDGPVDVTSVRADSDDQRFIDDRIRAQRGNVPPDGSPQYLNQARTARRLLARDRADMLSEAEELVYANETPLPDAARILRARAKRHGLEDDPALVPLLTAAHTGDRQAYETALDQIAETRNLQRVGGDRSLGFDQTVRYDRKLHKPIGEPIRGDGALVRVVRPGWKTTDDGTEILLDKAVVEELTPDEVRELTRDQTAAAGHHDRSCVNPLHPGPCQWSNKTTTMPAILETSQ